MISPNHSEPDNGLPFGFHLSQNYPNPFRDKTTIKYCLPYTTRVNLTVSDAAGHMIQRLVDKEEKAGTYEVEFPSGAGCDQLDGGSYIYRLQAGDFVQEKQMLVVR